MTHAEVLQLTARLLNPDWGIAEGMASCYVAGGDAADDAVKLARWVESLLLAESPVERKGNNSGISAPRY